MRRWVNRPEGSNWGDFGDEDEIGRLNLLTTEKVKQGIAEVTHGKVFCLSLPLDYPGGRLLAPHRFPPQLISTERKGMSYFHYAFSNEGIQYHDCGCDDAVTLCTQYSTQWDSLAHVGYLFDADGDGDPELVYYNGYKAGEHVRSPEDRRDSKNSSTSALGIEKMATNCVQGRGVMVDLEAHFGRKYHLVSYSDLRRVIELDRVVVEHGDILCLHTGFATLVLKMQRNPDVDVLRHSCAALDGTDQDLLEWITDSGIAAIAADNYAVEAVPGRNFSGACAFVPLHVHCLFKLGIHLGELWYFSELNAWLHQHGRSRFLLTAPPLRLPGAVGSPVTPVASV